jgi:periplasmic divalent cation tolerance protein
MDVAAPTSPRPILVLSTASSVEEAERIARALVDERLAACVNVVPGVRSIYRWQGAVHTDAEVSLFIKTVAERFPALRERVRELHSYELPELVCLELEDGDPDYLAWVRAQTEPG